MTSHVRALGSRAEVWHGNAKHTSGGLEKKHLMMNKRGRIVSRKKHATAKKQKRLEKAGFKATRSLSQGINELVKALPLLKRTQFANI